MERWVRPRGPCHPGPHLRGRSFGPHARRRADVATPFFLLAAGRAVGLSAATRRCITVMAR
eukprot:6826317-Lingulodinium_polyedra.AAC.1